MQSHIGLSWARQTLGKPYAEPHWARQTLGKPYAEPQWALLGSGNVRKSLFRPTLAWKTLGKPYADPHWARQTPGNPLFRATLGHTFKNPIGLYYTRLHLLGATNCRRKATHANLVYIYIYILDPHMSPSGDS